MYRCLWYAFLFAELSSAAAEGKIPSGLPYRRVLRALKDRHRGGERDSALLGWLLGNEGLHRLDECSWEELQQAYDHSRHYLQLSAESLAASFQPPEILAVDVRKDILLPGCQRGERPDRNSIDRARVTAVARAIAAALRGARR